MTQQKSLTTGSTAAPRPLKTNGMHGKFPVTREQVAPLFSFMQKQIEAGNNPTKSISLAGLTQAGFRERVGLDSETVLTDELVIQSLADYGFKTRSIAVEALELSRSNAIDIDALKRRTDGIDPELLERAAIAGRAHGRMQFRSVLRADNVSDEDIDRLYGVKGDATDDQFMLAIHDVVRRFANVESAVSEHDFLLKGDDDTLGLERRVNAIEQDTRSLDNRITGIEQTSPSDGDTDASKTVKIGLITGVIVGALVAIFLWTFRDYGFLYDLRIVTLWFLFSFGLTVLIGVLVSSRKNKRSSKDAASVHPDDEPSDSRQTASQSSN